MAWKYLPLLLIGCGLSTGCMRTHTRIVYSSFYDPNIQAVRIATNNKIPVTVGEEYAEQSFGGYFIISPADLKGFLNALPE